MQEYTGNKLDLSEGLVLVDFYATWCGPCKKMKVFLKSSAPDILPIVMVDTDTYEDVSAKYQISSLPTLILLQNGREMDRVEGYSEDRVRSLFKTAKMLMTSE